MSSKMDALLEPNRKLLNPFFQGYKLVHADSGMVLVSQPLPADIQTEPTLDKYCLGKAQHLASLKADVRWNALKILFTPMGSRYFMMDHGLTIWELDALYPLASTTATFQFKCHGRLPDQLHAGTSAGQRKSSLPDMVPLLTPMHELLFVANDAMGHIYFYLPAMNANAMFPLAAFAKGQVLDACYQASTQAYLVLSYEIEDSGNEKSMLHTASRPRDSDRAQFLATVTAVTLDADKPGISSTRVLFRYRSTTFPELALLHVDHLVLGSQVSFQPLQHDDTNDDTNDDSGDSDGHNHDNDNDDTENTLLQKSPHPVSLSGLLDEDALSVAEQDEASCEFTCRSFSLTNGRPVSSLSFLDHGWMPGFVPVKQVAMSNSGQASEARVQIIMAAQYDVDALLYRMDVPTLATQHVNTLHAFGYVQASKRDKKFIVVDPDAQSGLIVEWQSHAYLYQCKDVKESGKTAPQWIMHFEANEQVLGVQSFMKGQFLILTTRQIYLVGAIET